MKRILFTKLVPVPPVNINYIILKFFRGKGTIREEEGTRTGADKSVDGASVYPLNTARIPQESFRKSYCLYVNYKQQSIQEDFIIE